jgi:hypothetical protein
MELSRIACETAPTGFGGVHQGCRPGDTRYRAAVDGNEDPTVQLFDAEGNVIWSAP